MVADAVGAPSPLVEPPPALTPVDAAELAARVFAVEGPAAPLDSERDANFRIDSGGRSFVLKVYNSAELEDVVEMQTRAMLHVAATDPELPVPRLTRTREDALHGVVEIDGRQHAVHLIDFLPGECAEPDSFEPEALRVFGATVARVSKALRGFFHPAAERTLLWDMKQAAGLRPFLDDVEDSARSDLARRALDRVEERLLPALPRLRAQVIHNDLTYDNVLVGGDGNVTAIVDFGDTTHGPVLCDAAVALASFCLEPHLFERVEAFARGYGEITPLEEEEVELLADAVSARLLASALIAASRVRQFPENAEYINSFVPRTWQVLELFDDLGPEEVRRRFRTAAAPALAWPPQARPRSHPRVEELLERRRRLFGPAMMPLSYERPLHFVRGEGVWLFGADGRRYLDAYNNVAAVGHCHPRVVAALATQARFLNTNTRYLHETALELAERLIATMPAGLDTCLFVNSGSEANDLAWRFATTVTGGSGAIVTAWAYHGVTAVQTDLSPSEWVAEHRPDYVETIEPPGGQTEVASSVAVAVGALDARGHRPAALFLDSAHTSSGIFADAPDYLAGAVSAARTAGAFFVADEVQAGFGRLGSHMWSFETGDVEPDFVTLGKPMGNGHPIAALVTRADIAEEFARRAPPFFSTFGGNPVACAAALAVLDVIAEERLLENVTQVGRHLRAELDELAVRHRVIRDVRGCGLLVGVELTSADAARDVANVLRDRGVLIGLTGRGGSVLKIRPPMVFRREHADLLLEALDEALGKAR